MQPQRLAQRDPLYSTRLHVLRGSLLSGNQAFTPLDLGGVPHTSHNTMVGLVPSGLFVSKVWALLHVIVPLQLLWWDVPDKGNFLRHGLFWLTVEGCSHHSGKVKMAGVWRRFQTHICPHLITENHKCMLSIFSLLWQSMIVTQMIALLMAN